jgi:HAD superfamily phosphatase (TIGR01668 family)
MFDKFFPKEHISSPYKIDYEGYFRKGFRGILFDIDNTLVQHGADCSRRATRLFKRLKRIGFNVCLLSNNGEERVRRFNRRLNLKYIYKAGKPGIQCFIDAVNMIGCQEDNTLVVGDQIFTDIYGANKAGLYSVLVDPVSKKEELQIVLKRVLESVVLFFYRKRRVAIKV